MTSQCFNTRETTFNQTKHSMLTRTVEFRNRCRFRRTCADNTEIEEYEKHCLRIQRTKMWTTLTCDSFPMISQIPCKLSCATISRCNGRLRLQFFCTLCGQMREGREANQHVMAHARNIKLGVSEYIFFCLICTGPIKQAVVYVYEGLVPPSPLCRTKPRQHRRRLSTF